jgi:hypothetical protein
MKVMAAAGKERLWISPMVRVERIRRGNMGGKGTGNREHRNREHRNREEGKRRERGTPEQGTETM